MNPVSTRGRSMSRDRRTLRALVATTGLLCLALTTGCLRSTMLRPNDGPVPKSAPSTEPTPGSPAVAPATPSLGQGSEKPGNPVGTAAVARPAEVPPAEPTASPPVVPQAGTPPQPVQSALDSLGTQPDAVTPATSELVSDTSAANPTPLLDAAIDRLAAITSQNEPVNSPPAAAPSEEKAARADAQRPLTVPVTAPPIQATEVSLPADLSMSKSAIGPSLIEHNDPPAMAGVTSVPKPESPSIPVETQPKTDNVPLTKSPPPSPETSARSDERAHAAIDVTKPNPASVEPDPLGINKLTLCRKVLGFGSFEALADTHVKAGQRLLVYCEMTGMQYEEKHSEFVSRLSSRIEITSIANGTIVWMHELGPAEDACGSRRRDFYVNYRVDLPSSLPTGLYSLRLTQNDLVAQRSTSAEIPLEIVP